MTHKNIILLGATGSIGTSTLNLIRKRREKFKLIGVSTYEQTDKLKLISKEFNVKNVCFFKNDKGIIFDEGTNVMKGHKGLLELASLNCDIVVSGISGLAGLMPAYMALNNGNHIAIANKEPLVVAGNILIECSKKNNVKILPVDSEHNSIFQCFDKNLRDNINHITLTASGGPFLSRSLKSFKEITIEEALKHPKWKMGKKISVDSATLINKALEVIEAGFLFELKSNQINVVIHPESIIHGLVHYKDGSVLANLALPDMISPLSVAIGYPERYNLDIPKLDLVEVSQLNFFKPDLKKFPGLNFGWHALNEPNYFSIILNASNEIAVDLFLKKRIKFTSIVEIIDKCLNELKFNSANNLEDTLEIDKISRIFAKKSRKNFMFDNTFFISLIGFLVILTPLVFIHELGHYLAAIKNGVIVEQFSVGFGPELIGFTDKHNTRWKVCLIPFGGYVKMKGELLVNNENYKNNNVNKGYFNNASLFARLLIVFSGPLANIVLGIMIISTLYSFHGRYEVKPEVNQVVKNSPADRSGLKPNDQIISINNKKVYNFEDIRKIVVQHQDQLSFEILRNERIMFFNIKPEILNPKDLETKSFKIGIIASSPILIKHDFISSIYYGLKDTLLLTYEWIKGFVKLISFDVDKKDIAGPIGIAKISGNAISLGLPNFLFLMALLSINLGLINLLPIPALDGGYILMYFAEFILGRPISQKIQSKLIQIGVFFLMLLMIVITFFDIQKLFV